MDPSYCGKVFRGDMNSLGSHVYECKGEVRVTF